jgi:hypothetical protein
VRNAVIRHKSRTRVLACLLICSALLMLAAFYSSWMIPCYALLFMWLEIRAYVGSYLGNVFCTMTGNALRLMSKIGLIESCEKKVCLDVLHIELVIMYKLFVSLRVYDFIIKFLYHAVVRWLLLACLHLSSSVVNGPLCCDVVMLLQRMLLWRDIMSVRCACMCVLGDSYCVKTFYRVDVAVVDAVFDQLVTNNFYFFF